MKRNPRSLILAFDIGTSSLRTALFDNSVKRVPGSLAQQKYHLRLSQDGTAELSPAVFKRAAVGCLTQTLNFHRKHWKPGTAPITAVGISCFCHSLMGTDEKGKALTPIYTWADSRCREEAEWLRDNFSEEKIHERTGCMLRTSFWPAKLLWLRKSMGKAFLNVPRWMSPSEWLVKEFTGSFLNSVSMASTFGILDTHRLVWDPELLKITRLKKSQLNSFSTDIPHTGAPWSKKFPALAETLWYPGIGDAAASNLGSGATGGGLAAINVGTSAALRIVLAGRKVRVPYGLFCYRIDEKRYLVGGAVSNAGNVFAWCLKQLDVEGDLRKLEKLLARRPAPEHGLTVLPHLLAERSPTWCEEVPGALLGVTQATSALDILQASTEAVYHRMARIAELLPVKNARALRFIVSGGIQQSEQSLQRLADVMNRTLVVSDEQEASLRGAAVYASEKLGIKIPAVNKIRAVKPRAKYAKSFLQCRQRQIRLEKLLTSNLF